MAHVVSYSANRRSPAHVEYHEDPIPLHDLRIELALDVPLTRAYLAPDGGAIALERIGDRWRIEIPRVEIHAIAVLE